MKIADHHIATHDRRQSPTQHRGVAIAAEPGKARRGAQLSWLIALLLGNIAALAIEYLGDSSFQVALPLRLYLVAPLTLIGIAVNLRSSSYPWQAMTSAAPIFAFGLVLAIISLVRPEPGASRYIMADMFVIFAGAAAAPLSWRHTKILAFASALAITVVLVGFASAPFRWLNIDLVGMAIVVAMGGLAIRWKTEVQVIEIRRMRRKLSALHSFTKPMLNCSGFRPSMR